jgi:hypothetical protein
MRNLTATICLTVVVLLGSAGSGWGGDYQKGYAAYDTDKLVSTSSGTGFAVSANGHVITNHHVIEGCKNVKIHHKGKSIPATVVTFDPRNDLALLKGDFRPSSVLPLSTNSPELLQDVYVAGFPFGRKVSTSVKVTKGIISSLTGIGNNFSNIQIDAALQPGNSGGPILDEKGNVVGVAVARLDKIKVLKKFGSLPENTNFGIKTSVVRSILESSGVALANPNRSSISKSKLGKVISGGTYYLSCSMATAQLRKKKFAALTPPTASVDVEPMGTKRYALKAANVRSKPGIDGTKLTTLTQGKRVSVTGKVKGKNWYRVALDGGGIGYVFRPCPKVLRIGTPHELSEMPSLALSCA